MLINENLKKGPIHNGCMVWYPIKLYMIIKGGRIRIFLTKICVQIINNNVKKVC